MMTMDTGEDMKTAENMDMRKNNTKVSSFYSTNWMLLLHEKSMEYNTLIEYGILKWGMFYLNQYQIWNNNFKYHKKIASNVKENHLSSRKDSM